MNAPFTRSDFLHVFERYNDAMPAAPLVLGGLAASAIGGIVLGWKYGDRWACGVLTVLWLWAGAVFHLGFHADVNPVAVGFGILFVVQAGAFFRRGVMRHDIRFNPCENPKRTILGAVALAYAIGGYPLAAMASGHHWPAMPAFGAPCPTDILTLGLLFWSVPTTPRLLLVVPLIWALVASVGAWEFGMHEDWGLGLLAIIAFRFTAPRARTRDLTGRQHLGRKPIERRMWKHESRT